jgi:hypothetical protein
MTLDDVKKYLSENKDNEDVKAYLSELSTVSEDAKNKIIEEYKGGDEYKRAIQADKDKEVAKSIESWKKNNLDKVVSERYRELHPDETPEQKRIRELEETIEKERRERIKNEQMGVALKLAQGHGIPVDALDRILGENEAETTASVKKYAESLSAWKKKAVDEEVTKRLGGGGAPPAGTSEPHKEQSTEDYIREIFNK